jgi:glucose-6-phosphate dehydrogenase assembly protein OpcA
MAPPLVGRVTRDAAPEAAEHELAALWREIARRGTVARAVMSNLVVFRYHERRTRGRGGEEPADASRSFQDLVDAVIARHPSRTIVIEHDRGDHDVCAPMSTGVSVSIFGPPAAQYGIESIVVRSACAESSLPSIVRGFMRGGLPTSVWWTEDLSAAGSLPALIAMARQLVYDSRAWGDVAAGVRAVTSFEGDAPDLADLNWRRLAPIRMLLADAAASCGHVKVTADRMAIHHRAGEEALAWLLAGWVASRLHWSPPAWPRVVPSDERSILALSVQDDDLTLKATLDDRRVSLEATGRAPLAAAAASEDAAEAVAAELRRLERDVELCDALQTIAAHLG